MARKKPTVTDIVERAFIRGKRLAEQSPYDAKLLLECCIEINRLRMDLKKLARAASAEEAGNA